MSKHTIAVVEDDADIRSNVCRFLQKSGLEAWGVESAEDFYVRLLRDRADLVVVDLGLPGESGLSLVQRLVAQNIPVVVQTALGGVQDRIAGLEAGALQYFVKPTDLNELVAGIRALLRNTQASMGTGVQPAAWRLDKAQACLVAPDGQSVPLTSRELELLTCLMQARGGLVTKQQVLQATGDTDVHTGEAYHRIESMLSRLRRKTRDTTGQQLPVRAVFGRGLAFVA